jgi:hypothetical protein
MDMMLNLGYLPKLILPEVHVSPLQSSFFLSSDHVDVCFASPQRGSMFQVHYAYLPKNKQVVGTSFFTGSASKKDVNVRMKTNGGMTWIAKFRMNTIAHYEMFLL